MSERSKENAWKAFIRLRVSRVRIPLSPPEITDGLKSIIASIGPFATIGCEPRQVRKEATVVTDSGAEVWLVLAMMGFLLFTPIFEIFI
jgi:hypothetical protein